MKIICKHCKSSEFLVKKGIEKKKYYVCLACFHIFGYSEVEIIKRKYTRKAK